MKNKKKILKEIVNDNEKFCSSCGQETYPIEVPGDSFLLNGMVVNRYNSQTGQRYRHIWGNCTNKTCSRFNYRIRCACEHVYAFFGFGHKCKKCGYCR